eukprot:14294175-Alexandrium_andersonii.AAC.1
MCIRDSVSSPGSTPQGDPLAMLGMLTILLAPARRISADYPTTTLSLFADDRTAVADTAEDMLGIKRIWALLERATSLKKQRCQAERLELPAPHAWRARGVPRRRAYCPRSRPSGSRPDRYRQGN